MNNEIDNNKTYDVSLGIDGKAYYMMNFNVNKDFYHITRSIKGTNESELITLSEGPLQTLIDVISRIQK